jgi:predicted O-methyltransferase YrrM
MTNTNFSEWFSGKSLTTDWTSRFFPIWASFLAPRREEPLEILEIGSWEGRSAIFFLQYLKNCRMTCIDTFCGSPEHRLVPRWSEALPHVEERFDSNLAEFDGRVEKIKSTSREALARLITEGRGFDLAYIDGSHHSADVLADAVFTWPMIRNRGIVIFDDYEWRFFPSPVEHPKPGVDAFLSVRPDQYRELHRGYQLIIEKTEQSA